MERYFFFYVYDLVEILMILIGKMGIGKSSVMNVILRNRVFDIFSC